MVISGMALFRGLPPFSSSRVTINPAHPHSTADESTSITNSEADTEISFVLASLQLPQVIFDSWTSNAPHLPLTESYEPIHFDIALASVIASLSDSFTVTPPHPEAADSTITTKKMLRIYLSREMVLIDAIFAKSLSRAESSPCKWRF